MGEYLGRPVGNGNALLLLFFHPVVYRLYQRRVAAWSDFFILDFVPLVDLASLLLIASIFNWKIAIAYVVVGVVLAVVSGTIIEKSKLEKYVEPFVFSNKVMDIEQTELTRRDRIEFSKEQVLGIVKKFGCTCWLG